MKKNINYLFVFTFYILSIFDTEAQEPFIGEIRLFAGNFAPRGWALCEGQLLQINEHQALFSILGTTFGGDGQTSFALPDLRGRIPLGPNQGAGLQNYSWGATGGTETNTLALNQLPEHSHALNSGQVDVRIAVNNIEGETSNPHENYLAAGRGVYMDEVVPNKYLGGVMSSVSGETSSVGSGQSVENRQPFVAIHYIIALQGTFPSRN